MNEHIDELVSAYIDDELSTENRLIVNMHLQNCEQCNQLVKDLLNIQTDVMTFFNAVPAPAGLENKVLEKLKLRKKSDLFTIGITFVILFAILLIFGSFVFKIVSIFTNVGIGIIYTAALFIGSQPLTLISIIVFAIMLFIISSYSLRRLLRSNIREGDESFG